MLFYYLYLQTRYYLTRIIHETAKMACSLFLKMLYCLPFIMLLLHFGVFKFQVESLLWYSKVFIMRLVLRQDWRPVNFLEFILISLVAIWWSWTWCEYLMQTNYEKHLSSIVNSLEMSNKLGNLNSLFNFHSLLYFVNKVY